MEHQETSGNKTYDELSSKKLKNENLEQIAADSKLLQAHRAFYTNRKECEIHIFQEIYQLFLILEYSILYKTNNNSDVSLLVVSQQTVFQ